MVLRPRAVLRSELCDRTPTHALRRQAVSPAQAFVRLRHHPTWVTWPSPGETSPGHRRTDTLPGRLPSNLIKTSRLPNSVPSELGIERLGATATLNILGRKSFVTGPIVVVSYGA